MKTVPIEWEDDGFGCEATVLGFGLGVWQESPGWAWSIYNAWGHVLSGTAGTVYAAKRDAEKAVLKLVADALKPTPLTRPGVKIAGLAD